MGSYRTYATGGGTSGTSDRTITFTPAVNDTLVVNVNVSGNTNTTPTMTDNKGGTYTLLATALYNSSADIISTFIRDTLISSAEPTIITAATGVNNSGIIIVNMLSNFAYAGRELIRQVTSITNQAGGAASVFTFGHNCRTSSLTLGFTGDSSFVVQQPIPGPSGWTEQIGAAQATPTKGGLVVSRDSGFTGTTITYATVDPTVHAGIFLELTDQPDTNIPHFVYTPQVSVYSVKSGRVSIPEQRAKNTSSRVYTPSRRV